MNLSTATHVADQDSTPEPQGAARALCERYAQVTERGGLEWHTSFRILRLLGQGGQGIVYLSQREGCDQFTLPVSLKFFSPESYRDDDSYREDMQSIARIARAVALIQHDNLLDIHNFIEQEGIRIMEMEWIDGFNLQDLLTPRMYEATQAKLPADRWDYVRQVIMDMGKTQPLFKPGVAIQVLRECLAGLGALHREGLVHGDLKPSNIMLKRTGNAKIIDIGSATAVGKPQARRMWSPLYAAPEVIRGSANTPKSDLCSLGYILIEMLIGECPFAGLKTLDELFEAKTTLEARLPKMLPNEVASNELLLHLCRKMIAFDPAKRFPSAQAADLDRKGAADFHRQLVKYDLASEYEIDIRNWLEKLD
jgi:serine/threonine protein kinase